MDTELENVLDGLMSQGDVVGVVVINRSGEIVASKGVMDDTSVTDILQLEQSLKDEGVGAFKVGQRRLLLRREGETLIAVLKNGFPKAVVGLLG